MTDDIDPVEQFQQAVMSALGAADNYFVVQQQLSFVEIGNKLEMFLTAVLSKEEGFVKVSCLLHEHPGGNYFDVGIIIAGAMAGLRLQEVEIGKTSKSTLH